MLLKKQKGPCTIIKLSTLNNKMKTTWNIIKAETNRLNRPTTCKYQNSPDVFNKHFLSTAKKITHEITFNNEKGYSSNINPKYYLSQLPHKPIPNIKFNNMSTKEIEKIINSLN